MNYLSCYRLLMFGWLVCLVSAGLQADDRLFSGPQVGEKLPSFRVRGVLDEWAGKEMDFVAEAAGKPIVLIFVHDLNRQSISMTRILSAYTAGRKADGLHTGVVWLDDDATEAENTLKRIRHALTKNAPLGISLDGQEGPGSYGLNRAVTLTILVGHQGKVTANYALVQPSLVVDLPKILDSVVAVAGGTVPKLDELEGMPAMKPVDASGQEPPNLRPLLTPLIRKNATPEEVEKAAAEIEKACEKDAVVRKEVHRIAKTIVGSDKLENYGTPKAQEYLKKWSKELDAK